MPEAYRVTIEDPLQIPAAVYETRDRASDDEIHVLLDHQEEANVVRGYAEDRDTGIRRPDGGLSWYHNGTGCYMQAQPSERFRQIHAVTRDWLDDLTGRLAEHTDHEPGDVHCQGADADLYLDNGRQVIGTSAYQSSEVSVVRSCWYEDDPESERLDELLERDGIDPDEFYAQIEPVELMDDLEDELEAERVTADDFLSEASMEQAKELQSFEGGSLTGSCILTDYSDCR